MFWPRRLKQQLFTTYVFAPELFPFLSEGEKKKNLFSGVAAHGPWTNRRIPVKVTESKLLGRYLFWCSGSFCGPGHS